MYVSLCQPVSACVSLCQVAVLLAKIFLCGNKLVLIHLTTGFYGSSRQKRFCAVRHGILCILLVGSPGLHLRVSAGWRTDGVAGASNSYWQPKAPNNSSTIYIGRVYSIASYKISYFCSQLYLRQCQYIFTIVELL
jgi:hypothetical protein